MVPTDGANGVDNADPTKYGGNLLTAEVNDFSEASRRRQATPGGKRLQVWLRGVDKRRGAFTAIRRLAVEDEKFPVRFGPSACDRTTTIRMTAGFETVSAVTAPVWPAEHTGSSTRVTLGDTRLTASAHSGVRPGFGASRAFVFDGRTQEGVR